MADFPTSLKSFTNLTESTEMDDSGLEGDTVVNSIQDEIEAVQAKVGIDSSADTDSLDYKVTHTSSSNPGHKHTLAHGATDVTASAAELNALDGITASVTELNYTDGVTSSIQTQIDSKSDTGHSHTVTDVVLTASPGSDHTATGFKVELTAAEALVFGDTCYIDSNGKMAKADADAIATSSVIGMALETIDLDASGDFLLTGIARDDTWAWTVGGLIYLSTTAGAMTQTAPSGADDVIQILGVATHADRMYFNPQLVQIEHTG